MDVKDFGASALPTNYKNVEITFSSQLANGTSSINSGGTVVLELDCLYADYAASVPAQFSTCPLSGFTNFLLLTAKAKQLNNGLCHVTLTYQASFTGTPSTQYTESNCAAEEDIQNHPDFQTWVSSGWVTYEDDNVTFKGFTVDSGIPPATKSYVVSSRTVSVKAYFTSKPADASDTIGKTGSPGSDYSGSGHWLIIGSVRAQEGFFFTQTTTYKYSGIAWNSSIYTAV